MTFTSNSYILLLICTLILYYVPKFRTIQLQILIISSLIFYYFNQPVMVSLLILSISINAVVCHLIVYGRYFNIKIISIAGVLFNLFILLFFKYSPFFADLFFKKSSSIGHLFLMIPIPIGISFTTFQAIGMMVDVSRNRRTHSKVFLSQSFLDQTKRVFFFQSFFPQLISGPITRIFDILPQISHKTYHNVEWIRCFKMLITGYFLKMVVADNLSDFTFWISYPYFYYQSTGSLLMMLFGYSCQIFADFAGYSLIAIGTAGLFGYSIKSNFNFPYIAESLQDFWRRWHISLSTWLRDYIFLPIAFFVSNKLKRDKYFRIRTDLWIYSIATFITFTICGFWHGVGLNFILWGCSFGMLLVFEKFLNIYIYKKLKHFKIRKSIWISFVKRINVFIIVTLLWLFFLFNSVAQIHELVKYLLTKEVSLEIVFMTKIFIYCLPVIIYHFHHTYKESSLKVIYKYDFAYYAMMLFLLITNSHASTSFIYFQF